MGDVVGRTSREEQLALALDELAHLGVVRIDEARDGKVLVQGRGRPWPARVSTRKSTGRSGTEMRL